MNAHNDMESYNRMLDAARLHAVTLRQKAIQDAYSAAGDSVARAARSAVRFANSLARHLRLRESAERTTYRT